MKTAGFLVSAAIVALASAAPASAQQLEDIVVTAQKKSENLQKVPIAITAISADAAKASGVRTSEDLNVVTPGLNLGRTSGGAAILLRGVGATTSQSGQDASVPVFIDGVYQISSASALLAFNNVERIEVLKGPQGTLYGRNASGGAINILTLTPSHDTMVDMELGYGNFDTIEGRFYGTTGLGQKAAVDVAAYYSHQGDGWGRNVNLNEDVNKRKDFSIRSKLLLEPVEGTAVTLAGAYSNGSGSTGSSYRPISSTVALDGTVGWSNGWWDTQGSRPFTGNKQYSLSGRIEQELGSLQLLSISAWQKATRKEFADLDTIPAQIIDYYFSSKSRAFTQEFQLLSDQGQRFRWILGAFFLDSKEGYDPFVLEGAGVAPFATITQDKAYMMTKSYAIFGQATYDVSDSTRITVGGRYTIDKRKVDAIQTGEFAGEAPGTGMVIVPRVVDSVTFKKPTWRFGIDHDLSATSMAYFTYSRGFKSGIYNLSVPDSPPVKPEVLDAFELGLKTTVLDRRVRFNPSVFYYKYKDIQVPNIQGGRQFLRNAAQSEIYGVDLDIEAAVTDQFTLRGGFEYLHARYEEFLNAPVTFPGTAGNIQVDCVADPAGCDVSGNRMPRTPDWTFNIAADYRVPIGSNELSFSVNYAYNDGWYWEADNRSVQKPFHLVNGQIAFTAPESKYTVRLWARNLLNEKYFAQVQAALSDLGVPAAPRTYGVSVGAKF